ncbi:hypothetical protein B0H16DRAFT_1575349, partial [Mycena metata]
MICTSSALILAFAAMRRTSASPLSVESLVGTTTLAGGTQSTGVVPQPGGPSGIATQKDPVVPVPSAATTATTERHRQEDHTAKTKTKTRHPKVSGTAAKGNKSSKKNKNKTNKDEHGHESQCGAQQGDHGHEAHPRPSGAKSESHGWHAHATGISSAGDPGPTSV